MLKNIKAFLIGLSDSGATRSVTAIETCTAAPHEAIVTVKTEYFMGYKPATYAEHVVQCAFFHSNARIVLMWDDPLSYQAAQLYNANANPAHTFE